MRHQAEMAAGTGGRNWAQARREGRHSSAPSRRQGCLQKLAAPPPSHLVHRHDVVCLPGIALHCPLHQLVQVGLVAPGLWRGRQADRQASGWPAVAVAWLAGKGGACRPVCAWTAAQRMPAAGSGRAAVGTDHEAGGARVDDAQPLLLPPPGTLLHSLHRGLQHSASPVAVCRSGRACGAGAAQRRICPADRVPHAHLQALDQGVAVEAAADADATLQLEQGTAVGGTVGLQPKPALALTAARQVGAVACIRCLVGGSPEAEQALCVPSWHRVDLHQCRLQQTIQPIPPAEQVGHAIQHRVWRVRSCRPRHRLGAVDAQSGTTGQEGLLVLALCAIAAGSAGQENAN